MRNPPARRARPPRSSGPPIWDVFRRARRHRPGPRAGRSPPLTILGDLAHNETVLADLRARGIRIENRLEAVATPAVMITAHGASDKTLRALRERGLRVLEATCPLVHYAHRAVKALVRENFHPVIIGQRDHVEVRGLTGDLAEFDVILTEEDVLQLAERPAFWRGRPDHPAD